MPARGWGECLTRHWGRMGWMWRATIKGVLARKVRLALTALAVVLGVTFVSGTYVLTDTLKH